MTVMDEVLAQYSLYQAAEQKYIFKMSQTASLVADGLEKYLGGATRRSEIVRLGNGAASGFTEAPWNTLTSTAKNVDFSLAVTLKETENFGHVTHVVFPMSVRADDGVYTFDLKDAGGRIQLSDLDVEGETFHPIYEAIVSRLKAIYNPAYYALTI